MIIYRVEVYCENTKKYVGPYKISGSLHMYDLGMENNRKRHPEPYKDGIDFNYVYHYFGCKSLNSLYNWFHDSKLRENMKPQHMIAIYDDFDCKFTIKGRKQVAFHLHDSILIGRIPFMKTLESSRNKAEKILRDYQKGS